MKQTTKRYLGIAAASALVIGVATGVFAHGGFGPGFGQGWGGHHGMIGGPGRMMGRPGGMMGGPRGMMGGPGWMMSGDPVASADQRLSGLKSTLEITTDQEGAWNAYAEAVKGRAGMMLVHRQAMMESGDFGPEQHFTFHQQGLEQMQKINTASQELYDVLTPGQQSTFGNLTGLYQGLR